MKLFPSILFALAVILTGSGCVNTQRTLVPIDRVPEPQPAKTEMPATPSAQPQTEVYTPAVTLPPATAPADFAAIDKSDSAYVTALDAHDLDGARAKLDQMGAFKGTVSAIHEPGAGNLQILNFDPDFRLALSAVLWSEDAGKFPDLKKLTGKEVLVTGKFTDYHDRTQIVLKSPEQIKVAQ